MADSSANPIVVLVTFPSPEDAQTIAAVLVDEHLAACVNLISGVRSLFFWDGVRQEATEVLAVVKTTDERLESLISRVISLHSYSVPEVIALPIVGGDKRYLQWVGRAVSDR
jgi:periplasmic divalent cation tolerance protein